MGRLINTTSIPIDGVIDIGDWFWFPTSSTIPDSRKYPGVGIGCPLSCGPVAVTLRTGSVRITP